MKFTVLAFFFLSSSALATCLRTDNISDGEPCKQDGSMGICASKICVQLPDEAQGTCKPSKE